jgi:hypothetical protein
MNTSRRLKRQAPAGNRGARDPFIGAGTQMAPRGFEEATSTDV